MHHLTLAAPEGKSQLLKLEGQMKILWGVKKKKKRERRMAGREVR